jgi:hypothetical protein
MPPRVQAMTTRQQLLPVVMAQRSGGDNKSLDRSGMSGPLIENLDAARQSFPPGQFQRYAASCMSTCSKPNSCLNGISISCIIFSMSEETTQNMPDGRSFEERVFARFDALDARLTKLEERVDSRLHETRPIWEAVLSRLDGIEGEMKAMNRRVRVLHDDILRAREDQEDLRERVTKLESEPSH